MCSWSTAATGLSPAPTLFYCTCFSYFSIGWRSLLPGWRQQRGASVPACPAVPHSGLSRLYRGTSHLTQISPSGAPTSRRPSREASRPTLRLSCRSELGGGGGRVRAWGVVVAPSPARGRPGGRRDREARHGAPPPAGRRGKQSRRGPPQASRQEDRTDGPPSAERRFVFQYTTNLLFRV